MTTPSTTTTTSTNSTDPRVLQTSMPINSSQVVGNYSTSLTVKPYIAPQVISFTATDMRPGVRVYIFYDGNNVSQYCAPGVQVQSPDWGRDKYMNMRSGKWGDAIYSDSDGRVSGQFKVPEGVFKTGVGILEISDIDDLNDAEKIKIATTIAAAKFVSGNLPVVKQTETPVTREPESAQLPFRRSFVDPAETNELTYFGNISEYSRELVAQSFKIPDNLGTPGVFISSVDLWFRNAPSSSITAPATERVRIYICEIKDGYPDDSTILPFSTTHMPTYFNHTVSPGNVTSVYSPINISSTGADSSYTRFYFQGAVYCLAGKEYAVVIKPYANDPAWWIWSSTLGTADINTKVTSTVPAWVGPSYSGANGQRGVNLKWSKWEQYHLKFRVNVHKFAQRSYGDAYFTEKSRDYLTLYNITFPNADTAYQKILPGDIAYLAGDYFTSSSSANVIGYDGSTRLHWGVVDHYDENRQILYLDTSEMWNSNFWFTTNKLYPEPSINTRFRTSGTFPNNSFIQIHRSSNNYNLVNLTGSSSYNQQTGESLASPPYPSQIRVLNGGVNNSTIVAYANTSNNYNPIINSIVPQFTTFTPPGTNIFWDYTGVSNTYATDSVDTKLSIMDEEKTLRDYERVVVSRSTANLDPTLLDAKTITLHARMTSDNQYLSPIIDMNRAEVLAVRNLVDPISSTYQEFFNTGSSRSKYVSQVITLAEGQDAEDLQVILSAYRPPSSDIQVWVKFLSADDSDGISTKTWTPMRNNNISLFCDPGNEEDFKDFTFTVPYSYPLVPTTGTITCNSSCTAIVGTNTLFQSEVGVGWYINMAANSTVNETSRKIVTISNNTYLTIDTAFNSNYTTNSYYIVPPPTSAWLSQNTSTIVDGLVSTSTTNNVITGYSVGFVANTSVINNTNDTIALTNANTYFNANNRIYYHVPAGNTAIGGLTGNTWYYVKTSNTTTVTLTDTIGGSLINITGATTNPGETHTFVSTNFNYWYQPGSIINVGGDNQTVISVANDTYLTVGTSWTSNNTNQPAYLVTSAGLTYENSGGAIYSKYKKFQIKVIFQSNDSSKVPILDNLRALSMQL